MIHSLGVGEIWLVNHFTPAHIINSFEVLIEILSMNGLDPKNVIINLWRKKQIKCYDSDFKKQTEIENNNFSLLAVEGFFHVPWMKYKRLRVLFYLNLLIESGYMLSKNYFNCLNNKKLRQNWQITVTDPLFPNDLFYLTFHYGLYKIFNFHLRNTCISELGKYVRFWIFEAWKKNF